MKSLDDKLARIRAGEYRPNDFIIADAKDADMAFGMMAPCCLLNRSLRTCGSIPGTGMCVPMR